MLRGADERLRFLRGESAAIDALLDAYASGVAAVSRPEMPLPRPLIGHYPMLETVSCGCDLCADWALRRSEFYAAQDTVPDGHKYHICDCQGCAFVKRVWMNYKAAENRRDLLIGASFHAFHNSRHGEAVMDWFAAEIARPSRSVNWWAMEGGRSPLSRWLRMCATALAPVVSGIVFEGIDL